MTGSAVVIFSFLVLWMKRLLFSVQLLAMLYWFGFFYDQFGCAML